MAGKNRTLQLLKNRSFGLINAESRLLRNRSPGFLYGSGSRHDTGKGQGRVEIPVRLWRKPLFKVAQGDPVLFHEKIEAGLGQAGNLAGLGDISPGQLADP